MELQSAEGKYIAPRCPWCRFEGSGFRIYGLGFRDYGFGFRDYGSGVKALGFRVQDLGIRVLGFWGSGFRPFRAWCLVLRL